MSEFRYDPIFGYWVAVAQIRGDRPKEYLQFESRRPNAICPFCPGNEALTPPPLLELTAADLPAGLDYPRAGWIVRGVPNKYPAIVPDSAPRQDVLGPFAAQHASGCQEIIIEAPRHLVGLSDLDPAELYLTFRALQLRIAAIAEMPHLRHLCVFKNCRSEAGASIEHAHWQLVGNPVLAPELDERWQRCRRAYQENGRRALFHEIAAWERAAETRWIEGRGAFHAFCPYAGRFPFQTWIGPTAACPPFEGLAPTELQALAELTRSITGRLDALLERPPYNILLQLPPLGSAYADAHEVAPWFLEVIPRVGRLAGFELASSGWINEVPPELAATQLREATPVAARSNE